MTTTARAITAHQSGDLTQAKFLYHQSLAEDPTNHETISNLGVIAFQQRRADEAIALYQQALDIKPDYGIAHSNMAAALCQMQLFKDALPFCRRALEMMPDSAPAITNLSDALIALGQFETAHAILEHILISKPDFPEALSNLGIVKAIRGDTQTARALFQQVAAVDGRVSDRAAKNAAVLALADQDWDRGWRYYARRFAADGISPRYPGHTPWEGDARPADTLLVVAEQGLGDELLYLPMMIETASAFEGRVFWEMDVRLMPFVHEFFHVPSNVTFIARKVMSPTHFTDGFSPATHRVDMGSLGKFFRRHETDFPGHPMTQKPGAWPPMRNGRVGISWRSVNNIHGLDKSVPIQNFLGIKKPMVSLQYGDTPDLYAVDPLNRQITKPTMDARYDIVGLAKLICSCDHVVTVSNTTAHLAGILGVPTTVLLNKGMGRYWYWGTGERTPWYPTVRVVRNDGRDWADILSELKI